MMQPILRWTIGPVHDIGFQTLVRSVKLIKKIYKDFDLFICYNGLNERKIDFLKRLETPLIDQKRLIEQKGVKLRCLPDGVAWKLYPPRLDLKRHEIFIDNDLLLHKELEEISWFLEGSDNFFVTEGVGRFFGNNDVHVSKGLNINSGLFGIPPFFDFAHEINNLSKHCWQNRYNEQGIVAAIVCSHKHKVVPLSKISVCGETWIGVGSHGIHFIGLNQGHVASWQKYLTYKTL